MYKTIIYWELIRIECRFTKYIYNIFSGVLFLIYIISRIKTCYFQNYSSSTFNKLYFKYLCFKFTITEYTGELKESERYVDNFNICKK